MQTANHADCADRSGSSRTDHSGIDKIKTDQKKLIEDNWKNKRQNKTMLHILTRIKMFDPTDNATDC
ncbi:hypothetical protein EGLA_19230 [Enterococcus gallinarum]|nr:hypothetical protein AH4_12220 [Enterococcus gallinarum]